MKCIEGEYGNICKEGGLFSSKTVVQNDVEEEREYKFKLSDIKKLLRSYRDTPYSVNNYYMRIGTVDTHHVYTVYFNYQFDEEYPIFPIKIGCKVYSRETVDRAIKAFL